MAVTDTGKRKVAHAQESIGGINRTQLALLLGLFVVLLGLVVGIILVRQRQTTQPEAAEGDNCPPGAKVICSWNSQSGVSYSVVIRENGDEVYNGGADGNGSRMSIEYSDPKQKYTYTCTVEPNDNCPPGSGSATCGETLPPPEIPDDTPPPTPFKTPSGPTEEPPSLSVTSTGSPRQLSATPTPPVIRTSSLRTMGTLSPTIVPSTTIKPTDIVVVIGTNTPTPRGYIRPISTNTPFVTKTSTTPQTTVFTSQGPTTTGVTSLPKSGIESATVVFFIIGFLIVALGLAIGV